MASSSLAATSSNPGNSSYRSLVKNCCALALSILTPLCSTGPVPARMAAIVVGSMAMTPSTGVPRWAIPAAASLATVGKSGARLNEAHSPSDGPQVAAVSGLTAVQ